MQPDPAANRPDNNNEETGPKIAKTHDIAPAIDEQPLPEVVTENDEDREGRRINVQLKNASMSTLSILLTTISILLAFTYVIFSISASSSAF
jgi:hypothetical protein